jgi:hypothetical protein
MPSSAPRTATTRRRGRPRSENPKNDRREGRFTEAEGRMLNAWMKKQGITVDNEALRTIILERLAADGITDPGPDSEEGQTPTSPWRPGAEVTSSDDPIRQLALTA